jgi:hypothetical protein
MLDGQVDIIEIKSTVGVGGPLVAAVVIQLGSSLS